MSALRPVEPGLQVVGLGKSYRRRPVVRDVSLTLRRGEAVGLLGPNGAGKTTCFYMITGLIPCDSGTILLDGVDVSRLPMYRRARLGLGYLPQEASIFRGLSVEDNIRAVLEIVEPDRRRRERWLDALLGPLGGRAPAGRDRPRARHQPVLCPARRALRRDRPDRGGRHPRPCRASQGSRHRRAHHRPQCAGNLGDH